MSAKVNLGTQNRKKIERFFRNRNFFSLKDIFTHLKALLISANCLRNCQPLYESRYYRMCFEPYESQSTIDTDCHTVTITYTVRNKAIIKGLMNHQQ